MLTSAGRTLHAEAVKLLAHSERVNEVMASVRSGQSGQLFLGCVPSGLFSALPAILDSFSNALEMRVTEAHTSDIIAAVTDGSLNAGLVWEDVLHRSCLSARSSTLVSSRRCTIRTDSLHASAFHLQNS